MKIKQIKAQLMRKKQRFLTEEVRSRTVSQALHDWRFFLESVLRSRALVKNEEINQERDWAAGGDCRNTSGSLVPLSRRRANLRLSQNESQEAQITVTVKLLEWRPALAQPRRQPRHCGRTRSAAQLARKYPFESRERENLTVQKSLWITQLKKENPNLSRKKSPFIQKVN